MSFEKFKEIYSQVPRLCVDLVIQSPAGILLTMRDIEPYKGFWHTPGGTVLFKERIEDAVTRKAETEVGVSVKIERALGFIEFFDSKNHNGFEDHTLSIVFLCTPLSTDFKLDSQAATYKFFKQIPQNTIPEIKQFLGQHGFDGGSAL